MLCDTKVIIPTCPGREDLLDRLLKTLPGEVQNGEGSLAQKRNAGGRRAKEGFILFVDDDNYFESDPTVELLKAFKDPLVGIAGVTAYHDDTRKIWDTGSIRLPLGFVIPAKPKKTIYEVSEISNAFMVRKSLFNTLGGFDDKTFPYNLDEADFCIRARRIGYKTVVVPKAISYHRSFTHSLLPNFRNKKWAYYMGRNRVVFQRKYFPKTVWLFLPLFIALYSFSLIRNLKMLPHFLKGVWHGVTDKTENIY
jgi:GT2 family glycosyltransferase